MYENFFTDHYNLNVKYVFKYWNYKYEKNHRWMYLNLIIIIFICLNKCKITNLSVLGVI